jgi:glutathione peroxidase
MKITGDSRGNPLTLSLKYFTTKLCYWQYRCEGLIIDSWKNMTAKQLSWNTSSRNNSMDLDSSSSYGPLFDDNYESIFQYNVLDMFGNLISMKSFHGQKKKAFIIVNVSGTSAFTNEHFEQLQEIYEKFSAQIEIIAFPCEDFDHHQSYRPHSHRHQDDHHEMELQVFSLINGITFPVMGNVSCEHETRSHPLFQYLKRTSKGQSIPIKSNFCKFVCDCKGKVRYRFNENSSILDLQESIYYLLHETQVC